jgi:hypothetical protein
MSKRYNGEMCGITYENMPLFWVVVLSVVLGLFNGFCLQYGIEFWAGYVLHAPVHVPFLACALLSLFLGEYSIALALVTWPCSGLL